MNKSIHLLKRKFSLAILFLSISLLGFSQSSFKKGIRTGLVKVKFTNAMAPAVSQMKVKKGPGVFSTGIKRFDAVVQQTKAVDMYRLFDIDPRYEAKLKKHGLDLWYVIEIDTLNDPETVAQKFRALGEIAVAEVDHEKILAPYTVTPYTATAAPSDALPFNDPLLKDQWHYENTGQLGVGDADINLFKAWEKTTGAGNIIVSVHDQGVDVKHEDLKGNLWINQAEYNGKPNVDDDNNGYVDDVYGYNFALRRGAIDPGYHGTHVAGTIAAVNNNGIGVAGVAGGNGSGNGVKIMSLQIFGGNALIEKTYIYAANNGAVISQNSWGYSVPGVSDQSLQDAIDYFVQEAGDYPGSPMKGGIVIFAAGNYNSDDAWYPGYYENTLSVASIGPEWKKAGYSNYGDWVDISAPGGDTQLYGARGGVLSTVPNNEYAYLEGTSMACPHVSGIAALALANAGKQLTADGLWDILTTGVRSIDEANPEYVGKLGSGAIDASLVTRTDLQLAPAAISNLSVIDIAQDFAILNWRVPEDQDDIQPLSFVLYVSDKPLNTTNLAAAMQIKLKNSKAVGDTCEFEVRNLLPLTPYYFAVRSYDRWGNLSDISNIATGTTNNGPAISVDVNSENIDLAIDASVTTNATHQIMISNTDAGLLRWSYFMRHRNTSLAFNASTLHYPLSVPMQGKSVIGRQSVHPVREQVRSRQPEVNSFTASEKVLSSWPSNIIGETDIRLTNSAAGRFYVSEEEGFNLTRLTLYLKQDPANGPVIIEIHKGTQYPNKDNLVYAQEYNNYSSAESFASVTLDEQLYFEKGETFWVVYHVPAGNLFPLGIGFESSAEASQQCFISFDMGSRWASLEETLGSKDFAFVMVAGSDQEYLGKYLSLTPGSGDISAYSKDSTLLTAEGSTLINGTYAANLVLASNDVNKPELRIPVNVTVSGHKPSIRPIDVINFGSVFIGKTKTVELLLENEGYGNYSVSDFQIDNPQFSFPQGTPWQIGARSEKSVTIQFKPSQAGNINGLLRFSNGEETTEIPVFGVGTETSQINVAPAIQSVNGITIGDTVQAQVTVGNTGKYPLKYFIPGFDSKGISKNWPEAYHKYGYKLRSNRTGEANPLTYAFQDISSTGVNITSRIKSEFKYYALDLGFNFPYYNRVMHTIYIANKGFTTFDNSVNPINIPNLNDPWSPKGYISPLGAHLNYEFTNGQVFYKVEPDRVIIQYDHVGDGYSGTVTAQMVIHSNGNIRFYYDLMEYDSFAQSYLTICMEDYDQSDGIMVSDWTKPTELYSGLALGFDYPGPDIITGLTNGSGILMPGQSALLDLTMTTDSLVEGLTNRYLNIISNDPSNGQSNPLIQIDVTSGGSALPVISADSILFGDVLNGAVANRLLRIKNNGTASSNVSSTQWTDGDFVLEGETPASIIPGLYKDYNIIAPTSVVGSLEDHLVITYSDGSHDTVYVSASVLPAPDINADLRTLQHTLQRGEMYQEPFMVENTGAGILDLRIAGKQWLSFKTALKPSSIDYIFEKSNEGGVYQWTDLLDNGGTHYAPAADLTDKNQFYKTIALPFSFEFYGKAYDTIKVGENGVVSFEPDPSINFFTDSIPTSMYAGPAIMPCWSFGGFDTYHYNAADVGVFYKADTNRVIIEWRYLVDNFGTGDPFSFQLMLFRNGSMKFLYKPELDKMDAITGFAAIGLQESSSRGLMINDHMALDHGDGLVFTVIPQNRYQLNPGETVSGDLLLDAREVFAGLHNGTLQLESNVPGKESLSKAVELNVEGSVSLEMPDTVNFGTKVAYSEEYQAHNYTHDLTLVNDGDTPLEISNITLADESQPLSLMLWVEGSTWFPGYWDYIGNIFSPWAWETPVYKLMPGDKLKVKAAFFPELEGEYSNIVIFTTSSGEMNLTLLGQAVAPPVIEADQTPVEISMIQPTETESKSIGINNYAGNSRLEYKIGMEYFRMDPMLSEKEKYQPGDSSFRLKSITAVENKMPVNASKGDYNRSIRYSDKTRPDAFLGTGGLAPFSLATKFNAGERSFNLSHVEAWFRPELVESGIVKAEIRAGGTNIVNAQVLSEGSVTFSNPSENNDGYWMTIELDHPAYIYPGEDFYVVITYPLGIAYPQGCDTKAKEAPGRYLYSEEGVWYDLQDIFSYAQYGWMMAAHETTPVNTSWISLNSSDSGSLDPGMDATVDLKFEGLYAQRGVQRAKLVINSNDPYNPVIKIPVSLNLNDAPRFYNIPEEIVLKENSSRTIQVDVVDVEGNAFSLSPKETYNDLSWSFEAGVLEITFSPSYGSEGIHNYVFVAEDEYGAKREQTIPVKVEHANQAPVYIGAADVFQFHKTQSLSEFSKAELFADPDGDEFTFTVESSDPGVVKVFASTDGIMVKTMAEGNAQLVFTLTDNQGAVNVVSKEVSIDNSLGVEDQKINALSCYPNPAGSRTTLLLPQRGNEACRIRVYTMLGETVLLMRHTEDGQEAELDLSSLPAGTYFIEVSYSNAIYTSKLIRE